MTDTRLSRRLASDLDGVFPEFMAEMQGAVFNGARRWLPGRQDAEDITQEVFVRAYRALQSYDPERVATLRLRPWLFAITVNLCRNHARTRGRRPRQVALGKSEEKAPETTDQTAIDSLTTDEWRERLTRLAASQRDAIVLRHVVGLSYEEIGEVLDRPPGTVKSDVHRGLNRLRKLLASEELQ